MPANALLRSVSFVLDTASPACGAYAYGDLTRWNIATLRASGFDVGPTGNGPRPAASLGLPRIHELRSKVAKKNVGCACAPLERRACFASVFGDISNDRATDGILRPPSITCLIAASRNSGVYFRWP